MRSNIIINAARLAGAHQRVCLLKRLSAAYPARILVPSAAIVVAGSGRRFQSTSANAAGKAEVTPAVFRRLDTYERRHVGSLDNDIQSMLKQVDVSTIDEFISQVIPKDILNEGDLNIDPVDGYSESDLLARLSEIASENQVLRSYIGTGYYGTLVPAVIQRNILECPEWYTSYTPYQPEISQGRLESLLNYQTLISDLTGMDVANSSLLDEGTAAAEAMILSFNAAKGKRNVFHLDPLLHPQTIACVNSRAAPLGIKTVVGLPTEADKDNLCGVLVQYPGTDGSITDWTQLAKNVHSWGGLVSVATDLLALTILEPPSKFGADICLGSSQRFGVSLGYGGPHAAFFAVTDAFKRKMPGRLVGKSKDRLGDDAYRLALQTREQHIRREKATSNICTAQALLANMAAMYAVYHGPKGLRDIATRVHKLTSILALGLEKLGYEIVNKTWFDTLTVRTSDASYILDKAVKEKGINLRKSSITDVGISLDETVSQDDLVDILSVFAPNEDIVSYEFLYNLSEDENVQTRIPKKLDRSPQPILDYQVFNSYHSETEILRYMHHLQSKDLSLANSMIPLGSCTMKLNATTEMIPVTWKSFASLHPFVPVDQAAGYQILLKELEEDLASICGFDAASLQPNSGAQGEYTGLRTIRSYLASIGQSHRNVCLIPVSAHGTNPASAAMAGLKVVAIKCTSTGELDLQDLELKADKHKDNLAAIMITYPSTFGVFEPGVKRAIEIVHGHGGQVYMDGANMNAQIGLTSPGFIGADVCHLNLHKTFCIPHGGGGPGMGPICVRSHLEPFLPSHPIISSNENSNAILPVSAAPWGSASILPISWAYIKMMGSRGLTKATKIAILNANYMASRLEPHYKVLYTNESGRCAHEFILDMREFKKSAGIEAIDIAKRLQDYGFHAPTMSWPVANTLMIEPTESESLGELDRFCNALISIRKEIKDIEDGKQPKEDNLLTNSPHNHKDLLRQDWNRSYTRKQAAFPLPYLETRKFWPSVTRLDDSYGDMHLFCSCEPPSLNE